MTTPEVRAQASQGQFEDHEDKRWGEYYCTNCHHFLVALRPFRDVHCPVCRATGFPALRSADGFGFAYYLMSEGGKQEMAQAMPGWYCDSGGELVQYVYSPLPNSAFRKT